MTIFDKELSIMLAGEAGAGVQSVEAILTSLYKQAGYNVFNTKEYMSRVRGGTNSITIRISKERVRSQFGSPDIFIPFDINAYNRYQAEISKETKIITDKKIIDAQNIIHLGFSDIAQSAGGILYSSMAVAGAVAGIIGTDTSIMKSYIVKHFMTKEPNVVENNLKATENGWKAGRDLVKQAGLEIIIGSSKDVKNDILISGAESVALGAIAGGCDAVFAYPMSPSTGVFTALAGWSDKTHMVIEQVEDEIGVINMAIGAWYAGARAIVTTSGGGFALMSEGLSLSGMTETPAVIHLAQRPGPATGLPTRTEQGDLNLAIYAGHGIFGRVILAPGNLEQGYELTRYAFDIADKYQSPVIILTDQYFIDTCYNTPEFAIPTPPMKHIVEASENYRRYDLKNKIISPRSVPGYGSGTVCVDSDEHDESGRITEDLDGVSIEMKNRRYGKIELLKSIALPPDLYGNKDYDILFITWGSVLETALEAVSRVGGNTALLHFKQVYPVAQSAGDYFRRAKKIVVIENNQSAQFRDLIEYQFGLRIPDVILKYNGLQFTVCELCKKIKEIL